MKELSKRSIAVRGTTYGHGKRRHVCKFGRQGFVWDVIDAKT